MTIQDWGAIGELISGVAILVTLLYLAVQVKSARISATDANRANRVAGIHHINNRIFENQELQQAWLKSAGPGYTQVHADLSVELGISIDEAMLVQISGSDWVWLHWAQFRSVKTKEDEVELRNIITTWYGENPMKALISHPTMRLFFDVDFIEFVDDILANGK
jgi:hypothetical protein